ncbi:GRAM domain-containing protein 1B [Trichoplax sp. H2]|nr:GRAM domain-containing protein 1B [Trichoplax sp. H2]|eukprot:RDD40844.1 GRAM domain-containing protein 1B [Trichoplax sp. H2]
MDSKAKHGRSANRKETYAINDAGGEAASKKLLNIPGLDDEENKTSSRHSSPITISSSKSNTPEGALGNSPAIPNSTRSTMSDVNARASPTPLTSSKSNNTEITANKPHDSEEANGISLCAVFFSMVDSMIKSEELLDKTMSLTQLNSYRHLRKKKEINKEKKQALQDWIPVASPLHQALSSNYWSRYEEFHKLFSDLPDTEKLLTDHSCAVQRDILLHGRLYASQNWFCFYANIFGWETCFTIRLTDIKSILREKTAKVIPNAILIATEQDKYFFTSFSSRETAYMKIFRIWQNALMQEDGLNAVDLLCQLRSLDKTVDVDKDQDNKHMTKSRSAETLSVDKDDTPDANENAYLSATNKEQEEQSLYSAGQTDASSDYSEAESTDQIDVDMCDPGEEKYLSLLVSVIYEDPDTLPKTFIDEVYPVNVDTLFKTIFTGSETYYKFINERKTFDFVDDVWHEQDDGTKVRSVKYTITLNHSIGPKTSVTNELQKLSELSRKGHIYIVDCEVYNSPSIPYGESFYTQERFIVTRISHNKCRLRVSGGIKYKKSVWTIVKSLIDKNVYEGLDATLKVLHKHVENDIDNGSVVTRNRRKLKNNIKHLAKEVPEICDNKTSNDSDTTAPTTDSFTGMVAIPISYKVMTIVIKLQYLIDFIIEASPDRGKSWMISYLPNKIGIFLLLQVFLFYRVYLVEQQTNTFTSMSSVVNCLHNDDGKCQVPTTQEEWMNLLNQQKIIRNKEKAEFLKRIQHMEESIEKTVEYLKQLKDDMYGPQKTDS